MLLSWLVAQKWKPAQPFAQPHEIAFAIAAFSAPALIMAACYWNRLGFFPRYGTAAMLGGCLLMTGWLATITRRRQQASAAAAVIILLAFCWTRGGTKYLAEPYDDASFAYRTTSPELPFVASCGLTFLEMDHRESPQFSKRLFYLLDMESALKYTQASVLESYPAISRHIPMHANLVQYHEFVKHNRRFLVLASPNCPLEWLLRRLKDDGAAIRLVEESKFGYRDRYLYEVSFATQQD
jgi:hypothetical protein